MQVTMVCQRGWRTWKLEGTLETRPVLTRCSELSSGHWPGVSPAQPALTATGCAAEKSVGGISPEICQLCPLYRLKLRTPLLNNSTECLPFQHTLETPVLILHWKQPECPATWDRVKEEGPSYTVHYPVAIKNKVVYFVYGGVIPFLLIYPSPFFPLDNCKFVFYILSLFLFYKWIHLYYFLDFTYKWSHMIFIFLLVHLVWYFLGPSLLPLIAIFHFFVAE